jgi:hypothetical protein
MMAQVINILTMFLAFALAYNQTNAHNILPIMFDLHFKNMKLIQYFVGNAHAIQIVIDYDNNIVCPLLLHLVIHLNPIGATTNQPMVVFFLLAFFSRKHFDCVVFLVHLQH